MLLLDGRPIAKAWREELKEKITSLKSKGIEPQLGIILIGDDPASVMYTNLKSKVAQSLGIQADLIHLPTNTTTDEAVTAVTAVNEKRAVHAILIQLPLPDQIDTDRVLATIDRQKDADGLHPHSLGDLLIGNERAVPATPKGIFRLLEAYHISTVSKHVVIIGRSNILGKPLAAMFLNRNATVTICHSKTPDLSHFTHQADILVMDTGVPGLLTKEMVHPNLVVIDAGITRQDDGKVVGDVNYEEVAPHVKAITPVPGGVGPMTIAALLDTVIDLAERASHGSEIS